MGDPEDIYEEALVAQRKKSQRAKQLERARQEAILAQARTQLHAEQQAKMEKLRFTQIQEGVYQPPVPEQPPSSTSSASSAKDTSNWQTRWIAVPRRPDGQPLRPDISPIKVMVRENVLEDSEKSVGNLEQLGKWEQLRKSEKEGEGVSMSMASSVPSRYTNKENGTTNKTMTDEERMAKIQQLLSHPDTGVILTHTMMSCLSPLIMLCSILLYITILPFIVLLPRYSRLFAPPCIYHTRYV